jgi:hypothetical protein
MSYPPPSASPLVSLGIAGLALLVASLFVVGYVRAHAALGAPRERRLSVLAMTALATTAWLALTYLLSARGVLARFDVRPPPMALMFVVVLGGGIALGLSAVGKTLALGLPLAALVGVQAFRFPLELVMHQAASEGVMPVQMSYSGYNLDILTGISAALLAPLIAAGKAPRVLVVIWNAFGILMLAVIAIVAFVSSPMVRAFGDAPPQVNSWVVYPPFVWLPAILVLAALVGHVVVVRRLRLVGYSQLANS